MRARRPPPRFRPPAAPPPAGTHGLARVLSKLGLLSRQEAARRIASGRVTVDGAVVRDPERRTDPRRERIAVDGAPVRAAKKRYWVMNKPTGVVTTARDPQGRRTVYDVLREAAAGGAGGTEGERPPAPAPRPGIAPPSPAPPPWLFPVGRLDAMTSGLLIFTNDTAFGDLLTDERAGVPRTYETKVRGTVAGEAVERLRRGVTLDDGVRTRPAECRILRSNAGTTWLEITLREGRNRQVRRMCGAIGHEVVKLRRVRIGPVELGNLATGGVRVLTPAEVEAIRGMARRTSDASGRAQGGY